MWMPSLDLAGGLWARARRTLYTFFSRLSRYAQRFWLSRAYFPVLLTVAGAFMAAGQPVYGVEALGCIVIWLLAACPDLLAPVCPFFMAFLMSTQCYGQLSDFLPCAALVPPLVLALLWHFAVWPVTLRLGRSGMGLALVSIATLLGGCDVITRKQAVEPLSLYYTLGLGVGMLVLYVLFRSHLTEKRTYDLHRRFAGIFCALGMCMALAVLLAYLKAWLANGAVVGVLYLSYRNFATSVLLTALPMPFYLSLKHRGHLVTGGVMEAALRTAYWKLTGSNPPADAFQDIRGQKPWREASFSIGETTLRLAVASGLGSARALMDALRAGQVSYDFVEVMACPGGCSGGGGQPIHDGEDHAAQRGQRLYALDQESPIRFSHENPTIQTLYQEYLGHPLSETAHHLLHTDQRKWTL